MIGALGSYLAITRGDQARFRREQAARWEERRLSVYGDYARSVKATVTPAYRVAAHLGNDPHPHPLAPEAAEALLADASDARDPAWEALLLLGAPEVVAQGRRWAAVANAMESFLREQITDPVRWSALLEQQRVARERYYAAARVDLALPPGHPGRQPIEPPARDRG